MNSLASSSAVKLMVDEVSLEAFSGEGEVVALKLRFGDADCGVGGIDLRDAPMSWPVGSKLSLFCW
jgi:hypothetical protein